MNTRLRALVVLALILSSYAVSALDLPTPQITITLVRK